jgi:branched-chain amino acid transport system substrate-binding protein
VESSTTNQPFRLGASRRAYLRLLFVTSMGALALASEACRQATTSTTSPPTAATSAPAAAAAPTSAAGAAPTTASAAPTQAQAPAVTSGAKYPDAGISDTEIRIGDSYSYTGPNAPFGQALPPAVKAYFQYTNEEKGGVNGRQLTWISYDDGYDPAKALANVRRAIEQDTSFLVAFDLGTPMAQAVLPYLTDKGVPYFLPGTSASNFDDPKQFPTLIMAGPSYYANSKVLGIYVAQTFPGKKIGMLQQNGDPGPDFANGFKDGLGDQAKNLVPIETALPSDPSVDSQIQHLKDAGVEVWFNQAPAKQAVLGLQAAAKLGWQPQILMGTTNNNAQSVMAVAGPDATKDAITPLVLKDPSDPQWANDPPMKEYKDIVGKYQPKTNLNDGPTVQGFQSARVLVDVLQRMKEPTRASFVETVRSLQGYSTSVELPGITWNGSQTSNFMLTQAQLTKWDGERWVPFGSVLDSRK